MQQAFERVLELQTSWSKENTPAMIERGILIRETIPAELQANAAALQARLGEFGGDFKTQGRDGTGPKSRVPWVRFYNAHHSPNPRTGWYCVYLFHSRGDCVYLALAYSSTIWKNGSLVHKSESELAAALAWGRASFAPAVAGNLRIETGVSLGVRPSELGAAYERSIPYAIRYPRGAVPPIGRLYEDAEFFADLLAQVYRAQDLGQVPGEETPEAMAVLSESRIVPDRPPPGGGQGFGLSPAERRAVERRAMTLAKEHLLREGYAVTDVSLTQSYDFEARKGGRTIIVEVKGTTSPGDKIILTRNEVKIQKERAPNNALIVAHGIKLDRSGEKPKANGGTMWVVSPWYIDEAGLSPLSYEYTTNPE